MRWLVLLALLLLLVAPAASAAPAETLKFRDVSATMGFSCAIDVSDAVLCWGTRSRTPLSDPAPIRPLQIPLPHGFQPVQTALGEAGGCVRGKDGTVACWDWQQDGKLPVSFTTSRIDGVEGAIDIGVGEDACAVTAAGKVLCWARYYGEKVPRLTHVAGADEAVEIAKSRYLTCVRQRDGEATCWRPREKPIVLPVSDAIAVSVGSGVCVARTIGTVDCWNELPHGKWGTTPTPLIGATGVVGMSRHQPLCAWDREGNVDCWVKQSEPPTRVAGLRAKQVAVGPHRCALAADGTISCWGNNSAGELGRPTDRVFLMAKDVVGLKKVVEIGVAPDFTCARTRDGRVACFGEGAMGNLGPAQVAASGTPVWIPGIAHAVDLSVGSWHACAVLASGRVRCWGANHSGQAPTDVDGVAHAVEVAASDDFTCARLSTGRVMCWGAIQARNRKGTDVFEIPDLKDAKRLLGSTGRQSMCALRPTGKMSCWGSDANPPPPPCVWSGDNCVQSSPQRPPDYGPTEYPAPAQGAAHDLPVRSDLVAPFAHDKDVIQVGTGRMHACALRKSGRVSCWGENDGGQVGAGTTGVSLQPAPLAFEL
jgi:hypothetical protein